MDSRMMNLVKNKTQRIDDAGAHMYHAATGVIDGQERPTKKQDTIAKFLARYRGLSNTSKRAKMYAMDEAANAADGNSHAL